MLALSCVQLRIRAQEVNKKREDLGKSAGGSWQKADLGNVQKWSLGDLRQFGQLMVKLTEDLEALERHRDDVKQNIRDLTNSMLKGVYIRLTICCFCSQSLQLERDGRRLLGLQRLGMMKSFRRCSERGNWDRSKVKPRRNFGNKFK